MESFYLLKPNNTSGFALFEKPHGETTVGLHKLQYYVCNDYLSRHYLTAPVIPSANCFWSTKKTTMVGMEQNNTPIIIIP